MGKNSISFLAVRFLGRLITIMDQLMRLTGPFLRLPFPVLWIASGSAGQLQLDEHPHYLTRYSW